MSEHPALPPVSRSYSGVWGRSVTHYSPVRHSHGRSKLQPIPFDLHVLSTGISHPTFQTAYAPFTPSNSGQRSLPTYYRGCWHVVSRSFLLGYRPFSSPKTEVYNPKTVFPHAASLGQGCPHCPISLTAASRRSLGRVSVPMWPVNLSVRLPIVAMVGRYLTI